MLSSRRKLEELLWVTGLHGVARRCYNRTVGRAAAAHHDRMRAFYRSLLPAGALVFDIGANLGAFANIFATLGARVVALEPNVDCVRHIELSYARSSIQVVQAVAGSRPGLGTLHLSDRRDDISSMSTDWMKRVSKQHGWSESLWSRQHVVPTITLDAMVSYFGDPYFIKIDVEGYEEQVLSGLSTQPPLLSFEFNLAHLDGACRCLENPVLSRDSQFNFALLDPIEFALPAWVDRATLLEALSALPQRDTYGDVFVRPGRADEARPRRLSQRASSL